MRRARGQVKEGTWGGTTNSKGLLKNDVETHSYRSLLKYIHI